MGLGQRGSTKTYIGGGIGVFVLAVFVIAVLVHHAQVNSGQVGVISHWGAIDVHEQPMQPGWHWITPFSGIEVTNVSVQQQNHSFKEVSTASKELQNVFVDGGINYHITAAEAAGIEINGGIDAYISRVFNPAFQDYIKEVIPSYSTTDILANRSKIRDAVLKKLQQKASDPAVNYHVTVDDLYITDIHFDRSYTAAIESAAVAQQQLNQSKIDAQKAAAVAQGTADAQRIQAQADHDANALRQQNLTPELIQYLMIQKWDGKLPQVTGNGSPFVSLTAK